MLTLVLLILFAGVLVLVAMHGEHTRNKEYHDGCYEDECVNEYRKFFAQQTKIDRIPIVPTVIQ
jgi:hypothetical protein